MIQVRHLRPFLALSVAALGAAAQVALAAPGASSALQPTPALSSAPALSGPSEAERLVSSVEARYGKEGSLAATFTQTFRSAATGQQLVERGRLWVKRPGQMRWDYRQPDKKVFVVHRDGTTISYVPADYTAIKGRIPPDAPHLRLLIGDSHLGDGFAATIVKLKQPVFPDSRQLRLTPRKPTDGIEVIYLELDRATLGVQRVLVVDPLGNESDLVLEKISEDAHVQDDVFDLQLPAGVTVRDGSAVGGP